MPDILQYRKVKGLEYQIGQGAIKIYIEGTIDNYYSKLDEVNINPEVIDLSHLSITKNIIRMDFSDPIICNINSGRFYSSMECGANLEGRNTNLIVEKLDDLKSRLGTLQDESVMRKKEEMRKRDPKRRWEE